MQITVASGKGGTGKTTVAASLATVWERPLTAVDLDVEEPNLHLFLRPVITQTSTAWMEIPLLDQDKCSGCRQCVDLCQFKAITMMLSTLQLYPDMCHGCGGCITICPEKALLPGKRELGCIQQGIAGKVAFLSGTLKVGEAMAPPLMEQVKERARQLAATMQSDVLVDAPPGVSCPAITAVRDADVIVLVTDATPFGFYDFKLAYQSFAPLGKPMGVVVNRAGFGTKDLYDFCARHTIPLLAEIPYDRSIGVAYSKGEVIADSTPALGALFSNLASAIQELSREPGHA